MFKENLNGYFFYTANTPFKLLTSFFIVRSGKRLLQNCWMMENNYL